jgi:methionyl-tRNA synthetase
MYIRLDALQSRTEEWIKRAWKDGKWSPNAVINSDGELVDARLKGGLRPSPVTRDLQWGVPVPVREGFDDEGMKGKVLCTYSRAFSLCSADSLLP